jgi:parvulin-like peptidyl-prolyl isomerase
MNLSVSKEEINEEYDRLVKESGEETLKKNIKDYYNWDVATFKEEIKNALLQQKLEDSVKKDETINSDQRKKAEEVLSKVRAGEDFATIAKEFSESTNSTDGGNMGWFTRGTYEEEYENQLFTLEKGQTSDVILADEGFEIVKIEDRKENEILARHILIKYVDFSKWIENKKNEYGTQKIIDTKKVKI